MFNLSKYTRWYYSIINRAKNQDRTKGVIYYELHHIIPKSLGGTNDKTNLVLLTFKEHIVCHMLLCKMVVSSAHKAKMYYALYCLTRTNNKEHFRYMTKFEQRKCLESYRIASSLRTHLPFKGKNHSIETKEKIRNKRTGVSTISVEGRKSIIQSNKSDIRRRNVSLGLRGKPKSESHKLALKLAYQRRKESGGSGGSRTHNRAPI